MRLTVAVTISLLGLSVCVSAIETLQVDPTMKAAGAIRACAERYFALPTFMEEALVDSDGSTRVFRQKINAELAQIFTGPLLQRERVWLGEIRVPGEGLTTVINRRKHIGGPSEFNVRFADAKTASVTRRIVVRELFSLDHNLRDVKDLFEKFPIANTTEAKVAQSLLTLAHPETVTFEVTVAKDVALALVETSTGWRVSDYREMIDSATLTLEF